MNRRVSDNNETAWRKLFNKYAIPEHISQDGWFIISAPAIKEFREPRLMTKFDSWAALPLIFKYNDLSILPISRTQYCISHFSAYHCLEAETQGTQVFSPPEFLESISPNTITSESMALNYALAAGIVTDFLEEHTVYATVSGRMRSGEFSFLIDCPSPSERSPLTIRNAQIEIDAAYEGAHCLALIEAKRSLSDTFLIRQLYYPYRAWRDRLTKKVRPLFMVYSNSIFRFFEYEFADTEYYNSLQLVKQRSYAIESMTISLCDIESVLLQTPICMEPSIAFPQADRFDRIINMCELLQEQPLTKHQITEQYEFDVRQTHYYTDAGIYLGLIEKYIENQNTMYRLSPHGETILKKDFRQRQLALCRCILSHGIFNQALRVTLACGEIPDRAALVEMMKTARLFHVESDSTYGRRATTVRAWIRWIVSLFLE